MEIGLRLLDEAIAEWDDPESLQRMRECRDALAVFEGAEWAGDWLKDGTAFEPALSDGATACIDAAALNTGARLQAVLRHVFGSYGPEGWED